MEENHAMSYDSIYINSDENQEQRSPSVHQGAAPKGAASRLRQNASELRVSDPQSPKAAELRVSDPQSPKAAELRVSDPQSPKAAEQYPRPLDELNKLYVPDEQERQRKLFKEYMTLPKPSKEKDGEGDPNWMSPTNQNLLLARHLWKEDNGAGGEYFDALIREEDPSVSPTGEVDWEYRLRKQRIGDDLDYDPEPPAPAEPRSGPFRGCAPAAAQPPSATEGRRPEAAPPHD